jgi:hypothetical protein
VTTSSALATICFINALRQTSVADVLRHDAGSRCAPMGNARPRAISYFASTSARGPRLALIKVAMTDCPSLWTTVRSLALPCPLSPQVLRSSIDE